VRTTLHKHVQTYYSEDQGPVSASDRRFIANLERIELYLTFFFLFDYLIYLYAADKRMKHAMQPLVVIDGITILPALFIFFVELGTEGSDQVHVQLDAVSKLNFLRFVRVLKLLRVLRLLRTVNQRTAQDTSGEITRQVLGMVLTGLSLIFCFAGLFQIIETNTNEVARSQPE